MSVELDIAHVAHAEFRVHLIFHNAPVRHCVFQVILCIFGGQSRGNNDNFVMWLLVEFSSAWYDLIAAMRTGEIILASGRG